MFSDDSDCKQLGELYIPQIEVGEVPFTETKRKKPIKGHFLRGPISLDWLSRACSLRGGKVVATALAIWFVAGLRGRKEDLKITSVTLKRFHVDASAKSRALKELEVAGLIEVRRKQGKNPRVTIVVQSDLGRSPRPV